MKYLNVYVRILEKCFLELFKNIFNIYSLLKEIDRLILNFITDSFNRYSDVYTHKAYYFNKSVF